MDTIIINCFVYVSLGWISVLWLRIDAHVKRCGKDAVGFNTCAVTSYDINLIGGSTVVDADDNDRG